MRSEESPPSKITSAEAPKTSPPEDGMNRVLVNNIQTLLAKREAEERHAGLQQRVAIGLPVSSAVCPLSICTLSIFGPRIAINLGWTGLSPFDPSFVVLAMASSVEAIFLSTFVRISQNRLSALSERRADLDLQISLLVEHEVTRILQVTRALAERMGIEFPADHEIKELEQDVEPSGVLDTHLFFEEPKLLLQHGSGVEVFLSWKFQKQSKNDYC